MIGAAAAAGAPALVSVPQLIGGGAVGTAVADSIPMTQRSALMARMLGEAAVIIESGVALTQEIHDGPFETYTGHGIWAGWDGGQTYSLEGKTLVRIDLDPNLEKVWQIERSGGKVQQSIDKGLPEDQDLQGSLPHGDVGLRAPGGLHPHRGGPRRGLARARLARGAGAGREPRAPLATRRSPPRAGRCGTGSSRLSACWTGSA